MKEWLISLIPVAALFDVIWHPEHFYAMAAIVDRIIR